VTGEPPAAPGAAAGDDGADGHRLADRLPGVVIALLGLVAGVEASGFEVAFLTDPVGPKALPYLVSAILVVAGIRSALEPKSDTAWPPAAARRKIGAAAAAFLLYAIALPFIGFFVSTTLVVACLSGLYGAPVRRGLPAAALVAGTLWLLFVWALALPLPVGELWMR
jgi:putative tricarboxylic transport membrane protein